MNYKRAPQKFVCLGMDLNRPVDLLAPGKYPYLKNVHSYQEGRLETRGPVNSINTAANISSPDTLMISSFRMNDYVLNNFSRFLKIGTSLYYGTNTFTLLDTGYSPLPFSPVAYRPDQSSRVWAYLGDPTKMRKANTSGTNYQVGVAPPIIIPTAELGVPLYFAPAAFDSAASWTNGGNAGAVSLTARLTGVTIGAIKYDTGSTGWCSIAPTGGNFSDITVGMRLIINSAETVTVEEIHKIFDTGTNSIEGINYDVGTSGLCTIQPLQALSGIRRNSMILIKGTEYVRVISVTPAPSGVSSFRCSTSGTFVAGDALAPPANGSIRVYTTGTRAAGNTLTANTLTTALTPGGPGAGYIAFNLGSPGYNLGNINNHPLGPDDYIHLGVLIDKPENLVEGKLLLDVDTNTTNTYSAADGNSNAYYITFRGNDLQAIVKESQTSDAARTTALQLQQQNAQLANFTTNQNADSAFGSGQSSTPSDVANADPTSPPLPNAISPTAQLMLGESQYTEFKWKLADLIRIGAAQGLNISDVRAIQFRFTVSDNCTITVHNLWVGGGYGPDTWTNLTPIIYRYRYRSSATGAHSRPGPAMRSGLITQRQQVNLTATASTDPQVDKIDWERFGGQNLEWHYVGTCPNSSPTLIDEQLSAAVKVNQALAVDSFQPFPISDIPRSCFVNVAGTSLVRTGGDTVNPAWTRGTVVIVGGKLTELYAAPNGDVLQVADSLPTGTGVVMEIPEPILDGQPLPYLWGPFNETIFACGNVLDAGSVYYTEFADPDSAPDTNRIEVCSPSEVLVHGCVYDGRSYVFSDKRMFALVPSFRKTSVELATSSSYSVIPVPNSKGLWAPYALAVGPKIWFMASDGIYESDGGSIVKISNDLNPLFPDGDRAGYAANGFLPIQMDAAGDASQISYLRLTYHNGELFFDYRDCQGNPITMVYDLKDKAWYFYQYFEGTSAKVVFHANEQGFEHNDAHTLLVIGTDIGMLFSCEGFGSGIETINCKIRTPALDVGDFRAKKIYGDLVHDINTNGYNVVATPYIDNYSTPLPSKILNTVTRQITPPQDIFLGVGKFARNLGVEYTWTLVT